MSFDLKGCWGKAAAALAIGLSLAGCESTADVAAKPNLLNNAVSASMTVCDKQADSPDAYAARLRTVLGKASSASLRFLQDNNITVCLDKRLGSVDTGFLESRPIAMYYPSNRVLTMRDNGRTESGLFDWNATSHAAKTLSKFREDFGGFFSDYTSVSAATERMVAHRGSCGKSCTTSKWQKESDWGFSGFHHAGVQTAPVFSTP